MYDPVEFGKRLRALRIERGLSQQELADEISLRVTYKTLNNNQQERLRAIAKAFHKQASQREKREVDKQ